MADTPRARELIQKHFDELLTADEKAELERLLESDPGTARLFSRMARTDGYIYSHFNQCRAEETVRIEIARGAPAPADSAPSWLTAGQSGPRGWRGLLEHLWGPTGAVLIHVAVIALLLQYTLHEKRQVDVYTEIEFADRDVLRLDDTPPPLNKPPDEPSGLPSEQGPITPLGTDDGPDPLANEPPLPSPDDQPGIDVAFNDSPLVLKDLGYGTRSESGRSNALARFNPILGRETEAAVVRALAWLQKTQAPDGSWGPNKTAMTGLALLTFLAHGETQTSPAYGPTVERAIRFLVAQQDDAGFFSRSRTGDGDAADPTVYAHAIATYGICEAYGLTRIQSLRPVMEKAVQVILDGQQPKGGWSYRFHKGARRDTSVAGWMIQALKSAYIAGAENPRLKESLDGAIDDLKAAYNPQTGRFGYTDRNGGSLGCTGIGVLCLQLLGHANDHEAEHGLQALREARVNWDAEKAQGWPLYEWYYITQAKFHRGGSGWDSWNMEFARVFVRRQNDDGSWPGASPSETGHGPVYSTTLAALTLQVYYRLLPTYQSVAVAPVAPASSKSVAVEIL